MAKEILMKNTVRFGAVIPSLEQNIPEKINCTVAVLSSERRSAKCWSGTWICQQWGLTRKARKECGPELRAGFCVISVRLNCARVSAEVFSCVTAEMVPEQQELI